MDITLADAWKRAGLDKAVFRKELNAAKAAADVLNPISMEFDVELGTNILWDVKKGGYYLSGPLTSYKQNEIDMIEFDSASSRSLSDIQTAFVHTHSRASSNELPERFSGSNLRNSDRGQIYWRQDLGNAVDRGINAYMASPGGNLYKFSFGSFYQDYQSDRRLDSYTTQVRSDIKTWP